MGRRNHIRDCHACLRQARNDISSRHSERVKRAWESLLHIGLISLFVILSTSCNKEQKVLYDGPDYIMFSDTLYTFGVVEQSGGNVEYFDIPVCATTVSDHDRNVGVEIIDKESTAIDGWHFSLESSTVVIPAGQRVAYARVRGYADRMEIAKNVTFTLNLVVSKDNEWSLYGTRTKVELQKCCPYLRENFATEQGRYVKITSSYAVSYMSSYYRLAKLVADPDDPDGIIIKDFLYDGYDIKVHLDASKRLEPKITYEEQIFAGTDVAFGTKYGDGNIRMYSPSGYTSYFSTCENFLLIYMTLYVKDVGVVGTFVNVCEVISDEEAERIKNEGF